MNNDETIVVEMPAFLNTFAESVRRFVGVVEQTVADGRGGQAVDYGSIERLFAERGADVERGAHTDVLSTLDVDAEGIEVKGLRYTRIGRTNGHYRSLAGEVVVARTLYRQVGLRNGPTVDAISLRTGTIGDGWLPHAVQAMAHLLQQGGSREAEATSRELGRLPYSRSSFERVPHELGDVLDAHHAEIEDDLIQRFGVPEAAASVSVSLDRTSVPMEEPRKRPPGRPRKGAAKRPVQRNYRMAWCGAVTLHDEDGEALHTIRYGRMPGLDPDSFTLGLANDVYHILQQRPDLDLVSLGDGAHEIWDLLDAHVNADTVGKEPHRLIDFWHVVEKLAPAAKGIGADEWRTVLEEWKSRLRRRSKAAAEILDELQASGCEESEYADDRPVHEAITYLTNHGHRMNYAAARRRGLGIGSGNMEATCKTLVSVRMKRSGSRWKVGTGEDVMRLRAWALSDRWEPAMERLLATQRTSVRRVA